MMSLVWLRGQAMMRLVWLRGQVMMSCVSRPPPDNIMWIEVKEGTSEEAKEDTFWENIVKNISKNLDRTVGTTPVKVMLSGQSMTEGIGAHACVLQAPSDNVKPVNMVSLYIQIDETSIKEAIDTAIDILKENLKGETYVKLTYPDGRFVIDLIDLIGKTEFTSNLTTDKQC